MRQRGSEPKASDDLTVGVVSWRRQRLERAGFEAQLAQRVASDGGFDLHAVLELIDRGCPPELAARILTPLDHPSR